MFENILLSSVSEMICCIERIYGNINVCKKFFCKTTERKETASQKISYVQRRMNVTWLMDLISLGIVNPQLSLQTFCKTRHIRYLKSSITLWRYVNERIYNKIMSEYVTNSALIMQQQCTL